MRKQLLLVLILSLMLAVTACGTSGGGGGSEADGDETVTFQATILEINLEIEYDGSIAESYPAQITNVYSISVVE